LKFNQAGGFEMQTKMKAILLMLVLLAAAGLACGDKTDNGSVSKDDSHNWFVGKWETAWKHGGVTETERSDGTYYELPIYKPAATGALRINEDGTYNWEDEDGTPISGKWRKGTREDDNSFDGKNLIVLFKGRRNMNWVVTYKGIEEGKDKISLNGDDGYANFLEGLRDGPTKPAPDFAKVAYKEGDSVEVETLAGNGIWCPGTVRSSRAQSDNTVVYSVSFKCPDAFETVGSFPPNRIRRR
jgi:hypothetical protein